MEKHLVFMDLKSCSWTVDIVKMSTVLKVIYRYNKILIKFPMTFFSDIEKNILKSVWNHKRAQLVKAISIN